MTRHELPLDGMKRIIDELDGSSKLSEALGDPASKSLGLVADGGLLRIELWEHLDPNAEKKKALVETVSRVVKNNSDFSPGEETPGDPGRLGIRLDAVKNIIFGLEANPTLKGLFNGQVSRNLVIAAEDNNIMIEKYWRLKLTEKENEDFIKVLDKVIKSNT
ncbi:MAG: hypothetical protein MSIBF_01865 [Candidatus Altiarchaeales archaeon IMC4]|nr:MAG: hypothetical protein MSIBF_01865 [Candidatus Altiarchaeales archaeon IMC4]